MAGSFSRKGSRLVGRLDRGERQVVVQLLEQVRELLRGDEADLPAVTGDPLRDLLNGLDRPVPTEQEIADRDPALQRLLPSASRDDQQLSAQFRSLAEGGIRSAKIANLTLAIDALTLEGGARVELDLRAAQAVMVAIGDIRLLLGERLGLRTDADAEALHQQLQDEQLETPSMMLGAYYDFLTWLQESLALALTS